MANSIFKAGDWVTVKSKEEILATLDSRGQLEGLPFMPQMLQYCGRKFKILKRAHKACDTAHSTGAREMKSAVHLDGLRCDGAAYGNCHAFCLLYWKDQWLNPEVASVRKTMPAMPADTVSSSCTESDLWTLTKEPAEDTAKFRYVCQATQLFHATKPLPFWKISQYLEDIQSGNTTCRQMVFPLFFSFYHNLATSGLGFGSALRWIYDCVQNIRGRMLYPWRKPKIPRGGRTPALKLNIQPGELVRVKSYDEILDTLDEQYLNRGMQFHAELVPYCGRTLRVIKRIERIINEKNGQLIELKNPCIILHGTECEGCFGRPLFCPRGCYAYWREIWLERLAPPQRVTGLEIPRGEAIIPQAESAV
jgi:hypothetical protein